MNSVRQISSKIDEVLEQRKVLLPKVDEHFRILDGKISQISEVVNQLQELLAIEDDADFKDQLQIHIEELTKKSQLLEEHKISIGEVKERFTRNTINIGVSGDARVGKSTTLQHFSGLSDEQIPTGKGFPVTAVRSEIYNSRDNFAEIQFRTKEEFIEDFVKPHIETIAEHLEDDQNLFVSNIFDFQSVHLPDTLRKNAGPNATKSLSALKEAKDYLNTYVDQLNGSKQKVGLESLRKYVAYPKLDELEARTATCLYLAVKSAKIYCDFPSVSGVKIGLIDLPGLGDTSQDIASMHTSGLENGVDQILLITKPTENEGYFKESILTNLDNLYSIQAGINRRSDLIEIGINIDENNRESAKALRYDLEDKINKQQDDKLSIVDFTAIDDKSVFALFDKLLDKLVANLPRMDREIFDYNVRKLENLRIDYSYSEIEILVNKIIQTIPLDDDIIREEQGNIVRALIDEYNRLEHNYYIKIGNNSKPKQEFLDKVKSIHSENSVLIESGFFKGSKNEWLNKSKGQGNYVVYLQTECSRIRTELIAKYSEVDVFYKSQVEALKSQFVEIFFKNTGRLREFFNFSNEDTDIYQVYELLISELNSRVRNTELSRGFDFARNVRFDFSQNVYYNIRQSINQLIDPLTENNDAPFVSDTAQKNMFSPAYSPEQKIKNVDHYLKKIALYSNDQLANQISNFDDTFNEFLFSTVSFFDDFMYRKDEERFKDNIRIMIREFKEYFFEQGEHQIDSRKANALKRVKESIARY